jgi:Xaa-Pro aminopeptidase
MSQPWLPADCVSPELPMLTPAGCRTRRLRLWDLVPNDLDWLLIADPKHLTYLANWYPSPFEFRSDGAAALLILGRDGTSILIADNLQEPYAAQAVVDEAVAPIWYRGRESAPDRGAFLVRNVLDRLSRCSGKSFGIEAAHLPAGVLQGLVDARLVEISALLRTLRRRKDADELALLRRSVQAGEAGFAAARQGLEQGMTELDLFLLIQASAQDAIGQQALIYGDFASGPRCELGGGAPTARIINAGELVLLDFSVVVWNYRADFACTLVCGGEPTPRQVELEAICLKALAAGESLLRAGTSCRLIDQTVRAVLVDLGVGQFHSGHLGHGIGLGHPEAPFIVPASGDELVAGDVVTLEPGVYIPGELGMRFERNYGIREEGCEVLTRHALEL